jgi:hypothetical protein
VDKNFAFKREMSKMKLTKNYHNIVLSLVLTFVFILSTDARADLFDDWTVVENNSGIANTYIDQISLDVTAFGAAMVDFTFSNVGSNPAAITGIYVEDGTLLGLASVIALDPIADDPTRSGIVFGQPAHPSNMPGWSTLNPQFYSNSGLTVGSNGAPDGVSPGESLVLRYALQSGKTFPDVLRAIGVGFDPSTYYVGGIWTEDHIRIGLHIQDVGQDSDTFILTPVPPSVIIGILGMGVSVAGLKMRKFA